MRFEEGDLIWWENSKVNKGVFIRMSASSNKMAVIVCLADGSMRLVEIDKLNPIDTCPTTPWIGD